MVRREQESKSVNYPVSQEALAIIPSRVQPPSQTAVSIVRSVAQLAKSETARGIFATVVTSIVLRKLVRWGIATLSKRTMSFARSDEHSQATLGNIPTELQPRWDIETTLVVGTIWSDDQGRVWFKALGQKVRRKDRP